MQVKRIRPQEGFQMKFLSSPADIVIGGGAAGGGKTFGLLMEPTRHTNVPGFGGIIFRRTSPQIKLEGGLWDTSVKLYLALSATPRESTLEWIFPKGQKIKFSHLEHEKNIYDYQGSQIPFIGFDELTHFSEKMFFYLISRNRSTCGVRPYVRATCNPDPESWVAELISWWIDEETGFPIPERDGIIRYFTKDGSTYIWGDSEQEVIEKASYLLDDRVKESGIEAKDFVKSITFVSGDVYGNRELLKTNPQYLANLMAQDAATKAALLDGNWHYVISDNDIYPYHNFLGVFENEFTSKSNERYITADIAGNGSDKFVVGVWYGKELMDLLIMDKSNGPQVVKGIKDMARKHSVPNARIIYDADGIGGLVDGFIVGAIPFKGNAPALEVYDKNARKMIKENYANIKSQLIYRQGQQVIDGHYRISPDVANRMYDEKMTVRQRFLHERKAFKRDKIDKEAPLRVIPKEQMKAILNNESPDLFDQFWMREYFEIVKRPTGVPGALSAFR